jgi:hypothetical protein
MKRIAIALFATNVMFVSSALAQDAKKPNILVIWGTTSAGRT